MRSCPGEELTHSVTCKYNAAHFLCLLESKLPLWQVIKSLHKPMAYRKVIMVELWSTFCRWHCRDNRDFSNVDMPTLVTQSVLDILVKGHFDCQPCRDLGGMTVNRPVSDVSTNLKQVYRIVKLPRLFQKPVFSTSCSYMVSTEKTPWDFNNSIYKKSY